jgi:hypothetical protein
MAEPVYDVLCSIGHLIDTLSICNIVCADANNKAIAERKKGHPSAQVLADCEWQARKSGERRVAARDEINRRLDEAIRRGGISVAPEARTYDLRGT